MSGELAAALENGEIEVAFQAIADIDTRRIVTAEALVRWRRPDGTLRPPSEFLEAAELAGLSRPLTRRVVNLSLDQVQRLARRRPQLTCRSTRPSRTCSTRASRTRSRPASQPRARRRRAQGRGHGELDRRQPGASQRRPDRARALGVEIALDDFGTGYSSLTHLRQLPVDRLKIDRSFVTNMCDETTDAAIVYATIELAHRLNLLVIAEGVEDEATWQALLEVGCEPSRATRSPDRSLPPISWTCSPQGASGHLAESQSVPTPASTASRGSIV